MKAMIGLFFMPDFWINHCLLLADVSRPPCAVSLRRQRIPHGENHQYPHGGGGETSNPFSTGFQLLRGSKDEHPDLDHRRHF
ncbi:hypothetical protein HUU39_11130 [candidate division KSB1 bacterium]|nr:hypothetical protein [candidate division KSB1 bacterium]